MSCWEVLEQRAKADRDKAIEAISEVRGRLEKQQVLCDRTQEIAEQYQRKIEGTLESATYFGDIQLYRTSLKQIQQAVVHIRTQIAKLEAELMTKQRVLTEANLERQKYQKLIEREKAQRARLIARREAHELDEIGRQVYYRNSKLA